LGRIGQGPDLACGPGGKYAPCGTLNWLHEDRMLSAATFGTFRSTPRVVPFTGTALHFAAILKGGWSLWRS